MADFNNASSSGHSRERALSKPLLVDGDGMPQAEIEFVSVAELLGTSFFKYQLIALCILNFIINSLVTYLWKTHGMSVLPIWPKTITTKGYAVESDVSGTAVIVPICICLFGKALNLTSQIS